MCTDLLPTWWSEHTLFLRAGHDFTDEMEKIAENWKINLVVVKTAERGQKNVTKIVAENLQNLWAKLWKPVVTKFTVHLIHWP